MATEGPTQGAVELDSRQRWDARPRVASAVRWTILLLPSLGALAITLLLSIAFPPEDMGVNQYVYLAGLVLTGLVIVVTLERFARRFLPLEALFRLSLVFPDGPPSRFRVLLRGGNPRALERVLAEVEAGERSELADQEYLETMLSLVNSLSGHDRLTRGHSERVRSYSETIGVELGVAEDDLDKLRWAAVLHDVGKLTVPREILNKPGRPDDDEWKVLSSHPSAGAAIAEPLRDWLGGWFSAIEHHHERVDGSGYPDGLVGSELHLGARIVCVADAYDVMTSSRSYKAPLSHTAARAELTKHSGSQFDPTVVRALARTAVPPARWNLGWLVALLNRPGFQVGASAASTATAVATAAVVGVVGISADIDVASAPEPALAFVVDEPASTTAAPGTTAAPSTTAMMSTTTTTAAPTTTETSTTTASIVPTTTVAPTTTTTTASPTTTAVLPTTTSTTTSTTSTTVAPTTTSTLPPPQAPVAGFTFEEVNGAVDFVETSAGGASTSWSWDFGDGNTSSVANPQHTYVAPGDYDVKLIVGNEFGRSSIGQTVSVS